MAAQDKIQVIVLKSKDGNKIYMLAPLGYSFSEVIDKEGDQAIQFQELLQDFPEQRTVKNKIIGDKQEDPEVEVIEKVVEDEEAPIAKKVPVEKRDIKVEGMLQATEKIVDEETIEEKKKKLDPELAKALESEEEIEIFSEGGLDELFPDGDDEENQQFGSVSSSMGIEEMLAVLDSDDEEGDLSEFGDLFGDTGEGMPEL